MKKLFFLVFSLLPVLAFSAEEERSTVTTATPAAGGFDEKAAERFAKLALACVHKEYPNKISHVLNSDADVAPPRKLTPAFCGCYDWDSSVHGHWLLVRLLRSFPDASFASAARDALQQSLSAENRAAGVSNGLMDYRGSSSYPLNCANGMIPMPNRWRSIFVLWRRQRWNA